MSGHESKGHNLVLRALSGFIDQLETSLLVHILQLPSHVQRHGVSSSPMGNMFASAPSKLPRSTSRTSYPSRLGGEVVMHVEPSQWRLCCGVACIIMLPCPCGQRGVRSRPVAFLWTQALCDCSASSLDPVLPWSGECAATDSRTSRIVRSTSQRCLPSGSQSVDDRSRPAPSSTGFPGCLSVTLCRAPTEPPEDSQHCSSCLSSLVAPVVAMQAGCPPIVPWGSTSEIPETECRRMPRIARTPCSVRVVSTV